MAEMIMEMNWMLILILIVVSAIVAYIGDIVGMRVGKKRVSIFGLRPKATSSLITVVSGILITILTLAVLSGTSQTVRTAIFSMKFVQKQITELTSQLQGSRTDLLDLENRLLENQKDIVSKQIQLAIGGTDVAGDNGESVLHKMVRGDLFAPMTKLLLVVFRHGPIVTDLWVDFTVEPIWIQHCRFQKEAKFQLVWQPF